MSQDDHNLPNDIEQLRAMVAAQSVALAQRDEVITQHSRVIAEREEKIAQHETIIADLHDTVEKQLKKLDGLHRQLARLLRRQYGPQKERIDVNQLTLFTVEELEQLAAELQQGTIDSVSTDDGSVDAPVSDDASATDCPKKPKKKGHGRRPLPEQLPREVVTHKLTDEERLCPCCGKLRCEIGSEVTEQLEFIPSSLKVIQHHRKKYACDVCEENVTIAPKPAQPIDKGLAGPGLLAHVVLSKYGDYSTLYRLEDILSRSGIILRRSTLCGWVAAAADLLTPLYNLMCDQVRASHVIHTDDTIIKMLEKKQCRNTRLWTYVGDEAHPFAVYEFSLTREGKEPTRFLQGFHGYLQADAYTGYDAVFAERDHDSRSRVIEVACMAHCRRKWWDSLETDSRRAHEALSYIGRLYELEEQFDQRNLTGDVLRDARQQHAIPILKAFKTWLDAEQPNCLPKSDINKAFTYTLNQWKALCRFTEDGALDIDNNLAERMVKLPAIGRRNWLFVGSESGGHRAAILLSMVASAKLCTVDPWAWLNAVMKELPLRLDANKTDKPPDLSDLLPNAWLNSHPQHRWQIEDIRKEERRRSRLQKISKRKRERS